MRHLVRLSFLEKGQMGMSETEPNTEQEEK